VVRIAPETGTSGRVVSQRGGEIPGIRMLTFRKTDGVLWFGSLHVSVIATRPACD